MKWLLIVAGMLMVLDARAQGLEPEFVHQVKPEYPKEMQRAGLTGEVRVQFMVNADGSVVDPKTLYSTHPDFAGATLSAVNQWRFAPWPLGGDNPKQIDVVAPLVFDFDTRTGDTGPKLAMDLDSATCRQLNTEVTENVMRRANKPLSQLKLFKLTRSRLIDGFIAKKYSSDQLAVGLYDLSEGMVKVVRTCQRKISRPFVDMLPESTKALISGSVSIGVVEQRQKNK